MPGGLWQEAVLSFPHFPAEVSAGAGTGTVALHIRGGEVGWVIHRSPATSPPAPGFCQHHGQGPFLIILCWAEILPAQGGWAGLAQSLLPRAGPRVWAPVLCPAGAHGALNASPEREDSQSPSGTQPSPALLHHPLRACGSQLCTAQQCTG